MLVPMTLSNPEMLDARTHFPANLRTYVSCGGTTRGESLCYIQCIIIVFTYYNVVP